LVPHRLANHRRGLRGNDYDPTVGGDATTGVSDGRRAVSGLGT
jgi:hypothetical protein